MRLSEKTIEINWCAQYVKASPQSVLWFGLTQKQEAQAGFDTCTKVDGRLLIFQFKASNHVLKSGARQFQLKHDQLTQLQVRAKHYVRSVFYVFPSVGETYEIAANPNILYQSQLLDVAQISRLGHPTKRDGTPRKTGVHYADVVNGKATLHSDPVDVELIDAAGFAETGLLGAEGFYRAFEDFDDFWSFRLAFSKNAAAVVVAAASKKLGAV